MFQGKYYIHIAAQVGNPEIVNILLNKGHATPTQRTQKMHCTPLHIACSQGHFEVVKTIIEDIEAKQSGFLSSYINILDKTKQTSLHHAQTLYEEATRFKIVEYLKEKGADVGLKDKRGTIAGMANPTKQRR